jgi:hypothetical protein
MNFDKAVFKIIVESYDVHNKFDIPIRIGYQKGKFFAAADTVRIRRKQQRPQQ